MCDDRRHGVAEVADPHLGRGLDQAATGGLWLEAYLRRTAPGDANWPTEVYSVAVCGERLPFEKSVTLPQLHWDFMPQWNQSQFFIAPTHLNCDRDLDGEIVGTVERLGVIIAYVKDRRALTRPVATATRGSSREGS
jgi:hypothetical protein